MTEFSMVSAEVSGGSETIEREKDTLIGGMA